VDVSRYLGLLRGVRLPVRLVYGEGSGQGGVLEELRRTWPGAAVTVLPGGHNLHLERPAELARIIAEAASRVEAVAP
jgi:pimeloyl-ACP methyl ester carboxylesterase